MRGCEQRYKSSVRAQADPPAFVLDLHTYVTFQHAPSTRSASTPSRPQRFVFLIGLSKPSATKVPQAVHVAQSYPLRPSLSLLASARQPLFHKSQILKCSQHPCLLFESTLPIDHLSLTALASDRNPLCIHIEGFYKGTASSSSCFLGVCYKWLAPPPCMREPSSSQQKITLPLSHPPNRRS